MYACWLQLRDTSVIPVDRIQNFALLHVVWPLQVQDKERRPNGLFPENELFLLSLRAVDLIDDNVNIRQDWLTCEQVAQHTLPLATPPDDDRDPRFRRAQK